MNLSAHFSLGELTVSQEASRRGIDNIPGLEIVDNLRWLASLLEEIRDLLGTPIIISSGYRSPKLNSAIGGSKNSQHVQGLAADFISPNFGDPYEVASAISSSALKYDQLILEYYTKPNGGWVHISISDAPRRAGLTAIMTKTGTAYINGIKSNG